MYCTPKNALSYVVYGSFSRPDAEYNITLHLRHLAVKGRLRRNVELMFIIKH